MLFRISGISGQNRTFHVLSVFEKINIKPHEPARFILIELSSFVLNAHRSQKDGLCPPRGSILFPRFQRSLSPLSDTNGREE